MANSEDWGALAIYVLASLALLFNIVTAASAALVPNWVTTYSNIAYLSIPLAIGAIALANERSNTLLDFEFFPKNKPGLMNDASNKISVSIVAAIVVSVIAVFIASLNVLPDAFNVFTLSFIPPLQSFIPSQTGVQTVFVVVVLGPIGEEFLFRNILNPTFKKTIKNYGAHLIIGFFGLYIMFLGNNFAIGFLLLVLAFIIWRVTPINEFILGTAGATAFLAYLLSSTLFGAYHIGVYSLLTNTQNALVGAVSFGMVVSYFNDFFETGIGSWIIHSVTNGYVMFVTFNSQQMLLYIVVMIVVTIGLVLVASKLKKLVFQPQKIIMIGR